MFSALLFTASLLFGGSLGGLIGRLTNIHEKSRVLDILCIGIPLILGFSILMAAICIYDRSFGNPIGEFPSGIWRLEYVGEMTQNHHVVLLLSQENTFKLVKLLPEKIPKVTAGDYLIWDPKDKRVIVVKSE